MYPELPYEGISWPIIQHSLYVTEDVIKGLIYACIDFNGKTVNPASINERIINSNLLTHNFRKDSEKIEAWRDYQQILSELGLIYSTKLENKIRLTPIAIAFIDGIISYQEMITIQVLKYQYPNGHKTDISSTLRSCLSDQFKTINSLTELQTLCNLQVRPAVLIWQVLLGLYKKTYRNYLSVDEIQNYVVRCASHYDVDKCVEDIIDYRVNHIFKYKLLGNRVRRNVQDWIKILAQTPLFYNDRNNVYFSNYAINNLEEINNICSQLSNPNSFWVINSTFLQEYKYNWFSYYGDINANVNLIPLEESNDNPDEKTSILVKDEINKSDIINLQPYQDIILNANITEKKVISEYDYSKSRRGGMLHDGMVNLIASICNSKGADVYVDPKSVDLYIKYKDNEFIVEVKSITPTNFVARLRTAIGQVLQYDYMFNKKSVINQRILGLAFAAEVSKESWQIPFVNDYLKMDFLCLQSGNLLVYSNNNLSLELYK